MKRLCLFGLVVALCSSTFAGTVQHIPNHIAGWRGGWNATWHPRIEYWPQDQAGCSFAEFDRSAIQNEINSVVALHGGWDAKLIVTQVEWTNDPIASDLNPVAGAADLESSTISWFSAYAYSAGNGSWRYNGANYGSFAEAVSAGVAAGGSSVFLAGTTHWQSVWKPTGQDPFSSVDYWDIVIDVPESLITHYLNNNNCVGLFVGAEKAGSGPTVFGYDQWGGAADIRIVIDPPQASTPWIVVSQSSINAMMNLGNPVSIPQSITVTDAGSGSLAWTAAEAPDVLWLSLANANGGDGDAFQYTIDVTAMTPGDYSTTIEVSDSAAGNSPVVITFQLSVFADASPTIELSPSSLTFEVTPADSPGASQSIMVNNTSFGSLNWTATIQSAPVSWLSLTNPSGSDGDSFSAVIDHSGLSRGQYTATVIVSDPAAQNSPQSATITLQVRDQDADIDQANSYDNAWKTGASGWATYCRNLIENKDPGNRTQGFIVRLGDSITYANPGGQWAHYGSGKTADDVAICAWMHATDSWPSPIHNNSANGWYLSRVDVPGRGGSYTARSSITTAGILSGWGGLPSADQMFTTGFANPDGKQYQDAEIVVILLGTNDVSGPRPTNDFISDLEDITEKILANNTIPVLVTLPPRRNRDAAINDYNTAVRNLAQAKHLPMIDLYEEMLRRRPGTTWDGTLISNDGVHPSSSYGGYGAASDPYSDNGAALSHSGCLLWCWLTVQKVKEIKTECIDDIVVENWLDPTDPDVDVVLNTEDTGLAFYASPTNQNEWLINRGSSSQVRIKNYDDPALIKWDLSSYAGQTITHAELHLARSNPDADVFALAAATINADWNEGTTGTAVNGNPCWRWRQYNASSPESSIEWTYPGSDFTTASYGNFGSLASYGCKDSDTFKTYEEGSTTWIALKLDPAVVHAMILDQHGVVVTDARGRTYQNPSIYTKEAGNSLQPRLYLKTVTDDTTPPGDPGSLTAEAGEWNGEVLLHFTAPSDPDDNTAFGYTVRYSLGTDFASATDAPRWSIPRPLAPGTDQAMLLENLVPGQTYTFFVQAYDKVGNTSNVVSTTFAVPAASSVPSLADSNLPVPEPTGKPILGQPGILNYWACTELAKVNPANGARLSDGYTTGDDDYKKTNMVWDSADNRITLHAGLNEVSSFQLILERIPSSLTNVSIAIDDLAGPASATINAADNIECFKLHYVNDSGSMYADPAIPLSSPFATSFDIPSVNNPSGVCQSVWTDIYIPRDAKPGTYSATVTIDCDQIGTPLQTELQIIIHNVQIPDAPTFLIDLNGYGNKWNSEASRYQVFQLCQKHRLTPNTLPYGWTGSVTSDRAPALTGSGPTTTISDWSTFTTNYGPFLDGSGYSSTHPTYPYHGPGENTPIPNFYTAFHEGWPVSLTDSSWGFDSSGAGWAYWNALVDAGDTSAWHDMPDLYGGFSTGYETGYKAVAREFAEYAQSQGWHGTAFQVYLNNKWYYDPCIALWILEEQNVADDFRATGYFLKLCKAGADSANAPDVQWHWRTDTSTRWGQNWGEMRGACNLHCIGGDVEWYYRQARYRQHIEPLAEDWWWYGTGPSPSDPLTQHSADILRQWSHGLTGGTPYWDNYHTDWTNADPLAILPSGDNVPGHGAFDGRIATIRMKAMRFGQQLAEYLALLSGEEQWNQTRVARAMSARYGDHTGIAYDAFGGDSYNNMSIEEHYRLHADLLVSLEQAQNPCDINGDGQVDLADYEEMNKALAGPATPVASPADLDSDGDVDLQDYSMFQACFE